jgi:hypothetical protein
METIIIYQTKSDACARNNGAGMKIVEIKEKGSAPCEDGTLVLSGSFVFFDQNDEKSGQFMQGEGYWRADKR